MAKANTEWKELITNHKLLPEGSVQIAFKNGDGLRVLFVRQASSWRTLAR